MSKPNYSKPRLGFHACNTNPCVLITPCIAYESFWGMRNGPDCWKLYVGWLRFEIGISWRGAWPRKTHP